jgi:predicted transcriptional regulator
LTTQRAGNSALDFELHTNYILPMSYTIQRQVRLDQVTADALKQVADQTKQTVSDVIRQAIEREVDHHYHYGATK